MTSSSPNQCGQVWNMCWEWKQFHWNLLDWVSPKKYLGAVKAGSIRAGQVKIIKAHYTLFIFNFENPRQNCKERFSKNTVIVKNPNMQPAHIRPGKGWVIVKSLTAGMVRGLTTRTGCQLSCLSVGTGADQSCPQKLSDCQAGVDGFDASVQFGSVTQLRPTLCGPMNRSRPGLPVHHQLRSLLKLMSIESVMPSSQLDA